MPFFLFPVILVSRSDTGCNHQPAKQKKKTFPPAKRYLQNHHNEPPSTQRTSTQHNHLVDMNPIVTNSPLLVSIQSNNHSANPLTQNCIQKSSHTLSLTSSRKQATTLSLTGSQILPTGLPHMLTTHPALTLLHVCEKTPRENSALPMEN